MSKRFGEGRDGLEILGSGEREREKGYDVYGGCVNIFFLTVLVRSFLCAFTFWEMMCV